MAKCVSVAGLVIRVSDAEAAALVTDGRGTYSPKREWKRQREARAKVWG